MWCAVGTVFALGLCGGGKGGETPLRGGGRELSGESMACQTEKKRGREEGTEVKGTRKRGTAGEKSWTKLIDEHT